ncbi:MAG: hypothetical protein J2P44_03800 [Candidatus Dormibacteraeota bacterium]|nr:hypothetical protein [Candidatus Dormibacteraeota bacterium]
MACTVPVYLGAAHAEHWFGLESVPGATVLSHVIEGYAVGRYRAIWQERTEPSHDLVIEALFDRVEAAIQTSVW